MTTRRTWLAAAGGAGLIAKAAPPDAARIEIDADQVVARVNPRIFGQFTEHLGRCIYGGIYDEGSALSDKAGLP